MGIRTTFRVVLDGVDRTLPWEPAGPGRWRCARDDPGVQAARFVLAHRRHRRGRPVRAATGRMDRRHLDGPVPGREPGRVPGVRPGRPASAIRPLVSRGAPQQPGILLRHRCDGGLGAPALRTDGRALLRLDRPPFGRQRLDHAASPAAVVLRPGPARGRRPRGRELAHDPRRRRRPSTPADTSLPSSPAHFRAHRRTICSPTTSDRPRASGTNGRSPRASRRPPPARSAVATRPRSAGLVTSSSRSRRRCGPSIAALRSAKGPCWPSTSATTPIPPAPSSARLPGPITAGPASPPSGASASPWASSSPRWLSACSTWEGLVPSRRADFENSDFALAVNACSR